MGIFLVLMQGRSKPLETRGGTKILCGSLYLKSKEFWVCRTHLTAPCILKTNVSPSCRHIIVSMLWEMNFYFQLLCLHALTFRGKKLGGGAVPHATALK